MDKRCRVGPWLWTAAAVALIGLSSCGGGRQAGPGEEAPQIEEFDVIADAYLFDARISFEGRPSTVRLEIYYTDSLIGIGGRGYLGKGALKGWLTEDSLMIYFPGTNDYVYEAVAHLLQSEKCPDVDVHVPLAGLLTTLPDSLNLSDDLEVRSNYGDSQKPAFEVDATGCPWQIEISYDRDNGRWQVDYFSFDNASNISLSARRRTVKHGAEVSSKRFAVQIPSDARRILP